MKFQSVPRRWWALLLSATLLATLVAGCTHLHSGHTNTRDYSTGDAPVDPPDNHEGHKKYDEMVSGGELYKMSCGSCHNARPIGERPFSNTEVYTTHMRQLAYLTGKEQRALIAYMRRWHDVGPPTPEVEPSPKRFFFSQPISELRDKAPAKAGKDAAPQEQAQPGADKPLSQRLQAILFNGSSVTPIIQKHALLFQPAIPFSLENDRGERIQVDAAAERRPVVLVFYLGYNCAECVAQLWALEKDLALFDELGTKVVAISDDPAEHTSAKFKKYGRFRFPVLSDPGNSVAEAYGVFQPAGGDRPESRQHGIFVINREGRVSWTNVGSEPYLDNRSILIEIARGAGLTGRSVSAP
jgi:peroxiredoxin